MIVSTKKRAAQWQFLDLNLLYWALPVVVCENMSQTITKSNTLLHCSAKQKHTWKHKVVIYSVYCLRRLACNLSRSFYLMKMCILLLIPLLLSYRPGTTRTRRWRLTCARNVRFLQSICRLVHLTYADGLDPFCLNQASPLRRQISEKHKLPDF